MNLLDDIQSAYETIKNGGVILYPTDTVWGIGCDATNAAAVQRIHEIKNRPANKNYIILVSNMRQLLKYIAAPPLNIEDTIADCNKPTTFILNGAINLPDNVINKNGSIAIRIPKDDFCLQLLKKIGNPIISTSANISGEATPTLFSTIPQQIIDAMDYTVFHRRTDVQIKAPSSIVQLLDDGSTHVIRE